VYARCPVGTLMWFTGSYEAIYLDIGVIELKYATVDLDNCHVIEGDTSFLKEASTKPIRIS
jgi:hypothetical protein